MTPRFMLVDLWKTAGHVRSNHKGRRKTYKVQKRKSQKEKAKKKKPKEKENGGKIKPQVVASSYHSSTLTPRVKRHSRSVEGSSNLKF